MLITGSPLASSFISMSVIGAVFVSFPAALLLKPFCKALGRVYCCARATETVLLPADKRKQCSCLRLFCSVTAPWQAEAASLVAGLDCLCSLAKSDCKQKTMEEKKELWLGNEAAATGCVAGEWNHGPYEVTGSLITYNIYAHIHTNTVLALSTPISVVGLPCPAESAPSICPGNKCSIHNLSPCF